MQDEVKQVLEGKSEGCIICGDCLEVLQSWPDNCIDTLITDPPYGLEFMGKDWDHGVPGIPFWKEALRVCKPGAIALVFGGTRTHHRLMCAMEDAGLEIRDCMMWLYGSGFPKSLDISKAIDKAAGIERKVVGFNENLRGRSDNRSRCKSGDFGLHDNGDITAPATDLAKLWSGYGTALKPAWEPIIVAMKPLDGTFAQNAEKWGVAGLWIDGGRIAVDKCDANCRTKPSQGGASWCNPIGYRPPENLPSQGRWPANLILDEEAGKLLDGQTQDVGNTKPHRIKSNIAKYEGYGSITHKSGEVMNYDEPNAKGASRFFYCAKASKSERGENNNHPIIKPLTLMEYLCKLTRTPTGGIILDMFAGSGTTGIACINTGRPYILIEKDPDYCEITSQRVKGVRNVQIPLFK